MPFVLDLACYAQDLEDADWNIDLDPAVVGDQLMLVYLDVYGNEYTEVKSRRDFTRTRAGAEERPVAAGGASGQEYREEQQWRTRPGGGS